MLCWQATSLTNQTDAHNSCSSSAMPTVFIVGAGPSGLVALKEMREAGCAAYCVDAKPSSTRPCDLEHAPTLIFPSPLVGCSSWCAACL